MKSKRMNNVSRKKIVYYRNLLKFHDPKVSKSLGQISFEIKLLQTNGPILFLIVHTSGKNNLKITCFQLLLLVNNSNKFQQKKSATMKNNTRLLRQPDEIFEERVKLLIKCNIFRKTKIKQFDINFDYAYNLNALLSAKGNSHLNNSFPFFLSKPVPCLYNVFI